VAYLNSLPVSEVVDGSVYNNQDLRTLTIDLNSYIDMERKRSTFIICVILRLSLRG
jgi:hypothetical protein